MYLMPSLYATKKWDMGQMPQYLYTSKEIGYFAEQFGGLYDRVAVLVNEMHFAA